MKDETYFFHQTPNEITNKLLMEVDIYLEEGDTILEPFRGEGSFYDNFPDRCIKDWCEIEMGRDYKYFTDQYFEDNLFDWVITNPPFRLQEGTKRINSFFSILQYFYPRVKKGLMLLGNIDCLNALTPKRMTTLGAEITKIVVVNIPKWRGRYFFIVIQKQSKGFVKYIC